MKTLQELLEKYLDYRRGLNYSPRSIEEYRYNCGLLLTFLAKRYQLVTVDGVRKNHLYAWQNSLQKRRNCKGMPLAARTVNCKISAARNFLHYLVERGYIMRSLAESLKQVKEPQFLPLAALEHAQIRTALRKIDTSTPEGYRDRTIIELLYSTGIRASELTGLDVDSVNYEAATAVVFGKGQKERIVPLGRTAMRFLSTYVKAVRPFLLRQGPKEALFLNRSGTRLQRYTLLKLVHKYFDYISDEINVTPHTFRRSCTTELIRADANLYHVKELLGHASLQTVKHYARLTINDLKKTHEKCHPRERDG